ncbi:PREDICTED: uncharacterized protein LOC104728035, partial [Camelina sativa]|uniref:Uncharacterized protein LOC104728035 n=1 Tax=Camelina sativa TaxID=90675 RepID=A0ABM1QN39_CAMSA
LSQLAIKFFLLFLVVDIDCIRILRETVGGWQQEADNKYGTLWASTNYVKRSLFLQDKVREYVQHWGEWKNHKGYPFYDLRNKIHGNLWPTQYDTFRQFEGTNLLTYLIYGLSAEADMV